MERKYYLDNIRWATVWLVLVYHAVWIFNGIGIFGGVGGFGGVMPVDVLMYAVYPWFMCLLFLIAGISSRYALMKRTAKEFFGERTRKLLVPSTLGLFVYHWMTGYLNLLVPTDGTRPIDLMPSFIVYPVAALSGIGPLWFLHVLWVMSLVLVIVRKLDSKDKFYDLCGKIPLWGIILLALPVWGASHVLITPMITIYRFGIYGLCFLLGYFVFSHDEVMDKLGKAHIPMLIAAIVLCVIFVAVMYGKDYTADSCLMHPFTNLFLWITILAILGCGKERWNRTGDRLALLSRTSFPIYIVHYLPLLASAYLTKFVLGWPAVPCYLVTFIAEVVLAPVIAMALTKVPLVRWLMFGIKKPEKKEEKACTN